MNKTRLKMIARLKKKARHHHKEAQRRDDYDCGNHLADVITGGRYNHHAHEYDRCVARLRRVDPHFPSP